MQELPLGPPRREKDEPDRNFLEGEGFTSKGRERAYLAPTSETITKTQVQTASIPNTNTKLFFCKAGRRVNVNKDRLYELLFRGRGISVHFTLERSGEPRGKETHTSLPSYKQSQWLCFHLMRCSLFRNSLFFNTILQLNLPQMTFSLYILVVLMHTAL